MSITHFLQSVKRYPHNPALWVDNKIFTYQELLDESYCLQQTLELSAKNNIDTSYYGLLTQRSKTTYTGLLASWLSGKGFIPLNSKQPITNNIAILKTTTIKNLIIDKHCLQYAKPLLEQAPHALHIIFTDISTLPDWCNDLKQHTYTLHYAKNTITTSPTIKNHTILAKQKPAYILFTSGTTGIPKGIQINQDNLATYFNNIIDNYPLTTNDRFIQLADISFDLSIHSLIAWGIGACVYCVPENQLTLPLAFVMQHQLTVWISVPSTITFLQTANLLNTTSLNSLHISFFCGESLNTLTAKAWQQATPNGCIENLYGPTETTVSVSGFSFDNHQKIPAIVPIGFPYQQHKFMIVDEQLDIVKPNEKGELLIGGPQLAEGYFGNDELTQSKFIKHSFAQHPEIQRWYRTGDLASYTKEHGYLFHGRLDRQIKLRGYRVELQEIEHQLQTISQASQVAVIAYPSQHTPEKLIGFVVKNQCDLSIIKTKMAEQLPAYIQLDDIQEYQSLPLNKNGKIDYQALKSRVKSTSLTP